MIQKTPTEVYVAPFSVPGYAAPLQLLIELPPKFPQEPPLLRLTRPVRHRVVDQVSGVQIAHHDALRNWTPTANLGFLVVSVLRDLSNPPPQPLSATPTVVAGPSGPAVSAAPSVTAAATAAFSSTMLTPPQPLQQQQPQQQQQPHRGSFHMQIPPFIPAVDVMTNEDLIRLIEDDAVFDDFLGRIECVRNARSTVHAAEAKVKQAAESNLRFKEPLESMQKQLTEETAKAALLQSRVDELSLLRRNFLQRTSPAVLRARLANQVGRLDQESESFAASVLEDAASATPTTTTTTTTTTSSSVDLKAFSAQYSSIRNHYHQLRLQLALAPAVSASTAASFPV